MCSTYTGNFFSNSFGTKLLEPVNAGPTDTEGRMHLPHHEVAESTVMKTWS